MDLPSPGGGDGGGRTAVYLRLHCMSPKNCRAIYCDKANYGPVSGGGETSDGAGFKAVAGSVEPRSGEDMAGGAVGGGGKGLRVRAGEGAEGEPEY